MKAVVAAFNQEKALVGAFSVITNLRMDRLKHYYWLLPEGAEGEGFVLDYKEPPKPFQVIKIVNTHNGNARDKSAKEFAVYVR